MPCQWPIYTSDYPSFAVPVDKSFPQFINDSNPDDIEPDAQILSDFDRPDSFVTYGGLRAQAALGAAGLRDVLGVEEGDVVAIYAANCVNWARIAHSIMWRGACFSAINHLASAHELVHYFNVSDPKVIATDMAGLPKVRAALKMKLSLPFVPKILLLDNGDVTGPHGLPLFPKDIISSHRTPLPPYDLSKGGTKTTPAGICFSSGTSGKPKAVLMSHYGLIAQLLTARTTNPFINNGFGREVFFPPFAHIYGLVVGVLFPAYCGTYVVAMPAFSLQPYLQRCSEIKATILRMVPATAIRIANDPSLASIDLSSVKTIMCTGAALATNVIDKLQLRFEGLDMANGLGMTEGTITILRGNSGIRKAGSVGKLASRVEIRVVGDNGVDVPRGEVGECWFRAPTLFIGYKNNAQETKAAFQDDWMKTGDVVRVDEDGFVWLTGRKKELIKYKGNQVAPAELEDALMSHPLVMDAGVCGVYDASQGTEVPVGYVVLRPSVAVKDRQRVLAEIKAHFDGRVSPYKRLRGGLFHLDVMPKGATGKLQRLDLPAKVAERRGAKGKL